MYAIVLFTWLASKNTSDNLAKSFALAWLLYLRDLLKIYKLW
jgi:hypothetical protein